MQKLLLSLAGLALAFTFMLSTGCNPDEPDPSNGPDARLVSESGFLDGNADVETGETFRVKVELTPGDAKLRSVTIYEDDVKLNTNFFTINGGALTSNNPFLIVGDDQNGVTYEFEISSSTTLNNVSTYEIEVEDESGLKDAVSVTITSTAPASTPIEKSLTGVLLNASGPSGTGGLDLDDGDGTGSTAASAEIRDMGINCSMPNATNWRKQIGTVNGAEMKRVVAANVENFSFANATTKEIIQAAFDTGDPIDSNLPTLYCNAADNVIVTDVTLPLVVGDMFVVKANGKIYLIRVDEVNNTTNDNDDNYVMSVKY